MTGAGEAVLLVAHGTVDHLDELPELLTNIRRGHAPPPELLAEVRRRYEAIGGQSPLNRINLELARKLEARLHCPVAMANRLFRPYPEEVLRALVGRGARRITVVPLAQHSAAIYGDAVKAAAERVDASLEIVPSSNWGSLPLLTDAFARSIVGTVGIPPTFGPEPPPPSARPPALLFTAHSLPVSVIEAGDPYERELRASAVAVAARVRELAPGVFGEDAVAFQSQGMSSGPGGRPMAWLGPDLRTSLQGLAAAGHREVVVAPIGFLADHVEILYDLDIEARAWAEELGIVLRRAPSLDTSDALVEALAHVARCPIQGPAVRPAVQIQRGDGGG